MCSAVPGKLLGCIQACALSAALLCSAARAAAAAEFTEARDRRTLTRAVEIWELPPDQKMQRHLLRLEGRVSFVDTYWRNFWIQEADGAGAYVMLAANPPRLREGQRIRIEGTIVPDQGLAAESVRVTVLQEFEPVVPLDATGRIRDLEALASQVVTAEGYVSSQLYVDDEHVRLLMIIDDRPVICWIRPDNPRAIPSWENKFLRVQALYSSRYIPTNTETTIELWCGPEKNVTVIGSLADSAIFNRPRSNIAQIPGLRPGTEVLIRGVVEGHEPGSQIMVRDASGQIAVRSIQRERMPFGVEVEVVGKVDSEGARWLLRGGLYRKAARDRTGGPSSSETSLDFADRIRQLSLEQAAAGLPVRISGMVSWSMPGSDFFFLQDLTGGIRVRFEPASMETPPLGKYLEVSGVTIAGGLMPAVQLQSFVDRGSMSHSDGRLVTFEQAITGREDGQWVAMRGFIQRTESDGDWRWIYVTTPGGEFVGHLQSPVNFVANPGSLIRVQGVCEATVDETGQATGVMLRVPFIHSISIEEDAPVDYYDLPLHSIKGLRRLSGARDLMRVRISAEVLHRTPGRSVYVQEDGVGLQLLSRQELPVAPGDRIDAVGILGWQGARIVLRETVYRKVGSGPAPAPVPLANPERLVSSLDARLVRTRGELIDASRQSDHTRLTLQTGRTSFEAILDREHSAFASEPPIGATLALTGIYHLGFDDSRQVRRFSLQLRSPADIAVVGRPRLWTVQRALIVAGVLAGVVLLGLAWVTALRRRVQQQTRQIREQLELQARLEAEVERAARLESLGVLAGGIAHDFNNLLTIIIGNLGLALSEDRLPESTARYLREIERGANRARALTRQLLTFAKGGDPVRMSVALADVVRGAADRALHGSTVRSDYIVPAELWPVLADKDQISQVIQNLVLNAVQAMPNGGTLLVSFANETVAAGAKKHLTAGRYVRITLSDNGEGISPENLPRIFDPYFSTRQTGSGLGLATVYSIVKRHSGIIEVESQLGQGTTFHLWLPASDAAPEEPPAAATAPSLVVPTAPVAAGAAPKPARVLLMDDEVSIQKMAGHVLERLGLDVTVVSDGAAALREFSLAQHTGRPFELLLLDLTIPGAMGGREVLELIRRMDAHVPAIVSSGYSSDPVMANHRAYGFQAVVQKPYEVGQLVAVVTRLLGRSA